MSNYWCGFDFSLTTINSIDIRSVAFLLCLQISSCLLTVPIVPFQCITLRPTRPPVPSLPRHRRALTMSPVHRSPRCQKLFRLFSLLVLVFSRSVACGITSLTLFNLNTQLYNLPAMAESFLYQLFLPHNVHFHVILPRLYLTSLT